MRGAAQHLPLVQAQELGSFIYDGLILQLRSMGPGLLVDRCIRSVGVQLLLPGQDAGIDLGRE